MNIMDIASLFDFLFVGISTLTKPASRSALSRGYIRTYKFTCPVPSRQRSRDVCLGLPLSTHRAKTG